MTYIPGFRQYLKIDGNAVGIITGGGVRDNSNLIDLRGIGNHFSQGLRAAMIQPEGNCSIIVQTARLIEEASRNADGSLDSFDMTYGDADQDGYIHKDCKVNTLRLSFRGGEPLQADVNWRGLYFDDDGVDTHVPPADNVLMFYEGDVTGLAGAPEILGGEITINQNLEWIPVIDNNLATKKRRAKYLAEGPCIISAMFRLTEPYTTDISADAVAYVTPITVTFSGDNTITLTLTNCKPETKELPFQPQAQAVEHTVAFRASSFTIT